MATMDLNSWLWSEANRGGYGMMEDYAPPNPYEDLAGRNPQDWSDADKLRVLRGKFDFGYGQTPESILARGSFDYTPGRSGSIMEDFSPLLTIAAIAAGAGGFSGGFGGLLGGAEGAVSGGLEGALGGEVLGSAGFGGGTVSGGSSLTDMIRATQTGDPYLRTGDIANAVEGTGSFSGVDTVAGGAESGFSTVTGDTTGTTTGGTTTGGTTTTGTTTGGTTGETISSGGVGGTDADAGVTSGGGTVGTGEGGGVNVSSDTDGMWERILNGTATADDWMHVLGVGGSTLLGVLGGNDLTESLERLANRYLDFGAPSRARFEAAMTPGFDPTSIPGYSGALDTASDTLLRRLSTQGNPYGNPGGLIEANRAIVSGTALPAINEYTRQNANTGFGSSMNAAANFGSAAAGSGGSVYNALGYGLDRLTAPEGSSLERLLNRVHRDSNRGTVTLI